MDANATGSGEVRAVAGRGPAAETRAATPELLAPAGGPAQLRAAVQAGADAVYLGVKELNARSGAENFERSDLDEVVRYAHLRGVRAYLTLNVLVHDAELPQALAIADDAARAGMDALIVQDLGLARRVSERFEGWRLHASTQIGCHNSATVARLADLGFARVTLARELALEEVERAVQTGRAADSEIETFVHGALCYSYSGQCLISSFVGGRSANRGLCPQACRMPYDVVGRTAQALRQQGAFPLSMRDLCGLPVLDRLAAVGVSALKIEGRVKSADYVAATVGVYRGALDRLSSGEPLDDIAGDLDWLADAFNRGFTGGLMVGESDDGLMAYGRPSNRGVVVGRLDDDAAADRLRVRLDRPIEVGDEIEVWTSGPSGGRLGRVSATVRAVEPGGALGSRPVVLTLGETVHGRSGDRVVRLTRAALAARGRELSRKGANERRIAIDLVVKARLGAPLAVEARSEDGAAVEARGPLIEPALTAPLAEAALIEHLGRLGNTVYEPRRWTVALDDGVGLSYGALHKIKDRLAEALDSARLEALRPTVRVAPVTDTTVREPARDATAPTASGEVSPTRAADRGGPRGHPKPRVHVVVVTRQQAEAAAAAGADVVSAPPAVAEALPGVGFWTPAIAHDDEAAGLSDRLRGWDGPILVANLGLVVPGRADQTSDWRLGVLNGVSAACLAELGADAVGLSPELSIAELGQVAQAADARGAVAEYLVHGWVEVMTAEHCPAQVLGGCARRCDACARREGWALRDAKGFSFPFMTEPSGRAHVFNAHELCLAQAVPEIIAAGVRSLRVDLALCVPADVTDVVETYVRLAASAESDPEGTRAFGESWRRRRAASGPLTTGHAFRPVA